MVPGILYVQSRPKSHWPEDVFNDWYSAHHIGHVVDAGLSDLAIRYKNSDPKAEWPYLAVYRLPDVERMKDEKILGAVPSKHELIPNGATWQESLDADMRTWVSIQSFEGKAGEGVRGKVLRSVTMEPGDDEDFDQWYKKEHLDMLAKVPGYRRCTRYKLLDPDPMGQPAGHARFIALHEYDTEDLPMEHIKPVIETEWSQRILKDAKVFKPEGWVKIAEVGATQTKL